MLTGQERRRGLALTALVAGSALAAPMGQLFGVTLTGDRITGCAALAIGIALALGGRVRWTAVHTALAAFVAVQMITSLAGAPRWPQGLKFVSIYALGLGTFVVAAELARGPAGRLAADRAWRIVGACVGALGAGFALVANATQTPLWGAGQAQLLAVGGQEPVEVDAVVVVFGAKATFPEWNLLSSFLLIGFTLGLWRWSAGAGGALTLLVGAVLGLVFGVTRAAWVAMVGIALAWILMERPGVRRVAVLGLVVLAALAGQAVSIGASPVVTRVIEPLVTGHDWNLTTRGAVNRHVARSWRGAPIIGQGAGSSNHLSVRVPDGRIATQVWTGNIELFLLHDSGVVGLAALLAVVGVVAAMTWRAGRRGGAGWRQWGRPLAVSGIALLWAWHFTHALWLMYPYVFLGCLVAAAEPGGET